MTSETGDLQFEYDRSVVGVEVEVGEFSISPEQIRAYCETMSEGNPQYASEYQGKTYFFVNEGAKKMFDKAPASFTTAMKYDAWCATAMAMGKKLASDPTLFSVVDGAVYFFSSAQAKAAFDKDPGSFIKKADAAFASLK